MAYGGRRRKELQAAEDALDVELATAVSRELDPLEQRAAVYVEDAQDVYEERVDAYAEEMEDRAAAREYAAREVAAEYAARLNMDVVAPAVDLLARDDRVDELEDAVKDARDIEHQTFAGYGRRHSDLKAALAEKGAGMQDYLDYVEGRVQVLKAAGNEETFRRYLTREDAEFQAVHDPEREHALVEAVLAAGWTEDRLEDSGSDADAARRLANDTPRR